MIGGLVKRALRVAARESITSAAQAAGTAIGETLGGVIAKRIDPEAKPAKPEEKP